MLADNPYINSIELLFKLFRDFKSIPMPAFISRKPSISIGILIAPIWTDLIAMPKLGKKIAVK